MSEKVLCPGLCPLGELCALCQFEELEHVSLLSLLSNGFICRDEENLCMWKSCPSGEFSTKSFSRGLDVLPEAKSSSFLVWEGLAPPRVVAFCRLAISGKVSTADTVRRRGFLLDNL